MDIENIVKVEDEYCICNHNFAAHEHPSKPWMAINGRVMETELSRCKLCSCHLWREKEALLDDESDAADAPSPHL